MACQTEIKAVADCVQLLTLKPPTTLETNIQSDCFRQILHKETLILENLPLASQVVSVSQVSWTQHTIQE